MRMILPSNRRYQWPEQADGIAAGLGDPPEAQRDSTRSMPRVRFSELAGEEGLVLTAARPIAAAAGYTPIMLITEWLTLNLRGDWAMRVDTHTVALRFASAEDRERAKAKLGAGP